MELSEFRFDLLQSVLAYAQSQLHHKDVSTILVWTGVISRLTRHPLFCFEWCLQMPHLPWDPALVSRHVPCLQDVVQNRQFSWVYGKDGLSSNRHATEEWVRAVPHPEWSLDPLERNRPLGSPAAAIPPPPPKRSLFRRVRWMTRPDNVYRKERHDAWNKTTAMVQATRRYLDEMTARYVRSFLC